MPVFRSTATEKKIRVVSAGQIHHCMSIATPTKCKSIHNVKDWPIHHSAYATARKYAKNLDKPDANSFPLERLDCFLGALHRPE